MTGREEKEGLHGVFQPTLNLLAPKRLAGAALETAKLIAVVAAAVLAVAASLVFGSFYTYLFAVSHEWLLAVPMIFFVGLWLLRVEAQIRSRSKGWISLLLWAVLLAGGALGAFAGTSAVLLEDGNGTAKARITGGQREYVRSESDYATAAYEHYLWHFADSIPVLKVPETTNWRLDHPIKGGPHGVLTLIAKLAVMLPFLTVATLALSQWTAYLRGDAGGRANA